MLLFLIFHNSWMSLECIDVFETVILGVLLVDLELMGFPRAGKFLGRGGAVVGSLLLPRLKWRLTRSRRLSQSIIQICVFKTQTWKGTWPWKTRLATTIWFISKSSSTFHEQSTVEHNSPFLFNLFSGSGKKHFSWKCWRHDLFFFFFKRTRFLLHLSKTAFCWCNFVEYQKWDKERKSR